MECGWELPTLIEVHKLNLPPRGNQQAVSVDTIMSIEFYLNFIGLLNNV